MGLLLLTSCQVPNPAFRLDRAGGSGGAGGVLNTGGLPQTGGAVGAGGITNTGVR